MASCFPAVAPCSVPSLHLLPPGNQWWTWKAAAQRRHPPCSSSLAALSLKPLAGTNAADADARQRAHNGPDTPVAWSREFTGIPSAAAHYIISASLFVQDILIIWVIK